MGEKYLTFELTKDGDQLEIHGNEEGLRDLAEVIEKLLKEPNIQEHTHLMTESWGGDELSPKSYYDGHTLLNMVTIYLWPKVRKWGHILQSSISTDRMSLEIA